MACGVGHNGVYSQSGLLQQVTGTSNWETVKISTRAGDTNFDVYYVDPTGSPTSGWQTMGNGSQVNEMMGGSVLYNTGAGERWILIELNGWSGKTVRITESQIAPWYTSGKWYDREAIAWSGGSGEQTVTVNSSNGVLNTSHAVDAVSSDTSLQGSILLPEMDAQHYYFIAPDTSTNVHIAMAWCDGSIVD
mgnify:CR=1 FL=1